jgi:nickel/cobalt exporter
MVDLDWKEYHDHDHEHEHEHEHDHEHEGHIEPKPLIFKVRPVL